jgi:hypothetical protein
MPRCKFSHAEEADPCNGNETKMYLETAIAEHHLLSPRSSVSGDFVVSIRLLAARIWDALFVSDEEEEEEEEEERGNQILESFWRPDECFFGAREAPKIPCTAKQLLGTASQVRTRDLLSKRINHKRHLPPSYGKK